LIHIYNFCIFLFEGKEKEKEKKKKNFFCFVFPGFTKKKKSGEKEENSIVDLQVLSRIV